MPASIIVAILFVLQGALLHLIVAVALLADRRHPSVRRESVLTGTVALLLAMAGVGMAVALGTGRIWARNVLVVLWSLGLFYSLITIGEEPVLLGLLGIVLTVVALGPDDADGQSLRQQGDGAANGQRLEPRQEASGIGS